eukprot:CAMPEP_0183370236 /NCGR_PEP_ID=MMETSP0164_2-20130417/101843_1 /TAXON_ID=221442 /ORGANISM="Coccolithus pelagicus ssp braarudi, Strain PLY182g" /LENGTH=54 /DNA_ID=CAMNT_0025546597 /DNA_START=98 /DNA_END=258 /DNA_ORIENTATION=+
MYGEYFGTPTQITAYALVRAVHLSVFLVESYRQQAVVDLSFNSIITWPSAIITT